MRILCVAEKPSIAKAVSEILSGGRFTASNTAIKYIKNYRFTSRVADWGECEVVFTSVAGHLTEANFADQWKIWTSCAPAALFEEAQIIETIPQGLAAWIPWLTIGIKGHL
jgi:DNA topoisomerase III